MDEFRPDELRELRATPDARRRIIAGAMERIEADRATLSPVAALLRFHATQARWLIPAAALIWVAFLVAESPTGVPTPSEDIGAAPVLDPARTSGAPVEMVEAMGIDVSAFAPFSDSPEALLVSRGGDGP